MAIERVAGRRLDLARRIIAEVITDRQVRDDHVEHSPVGRVCRPVTMDALRQAPERTRWLRIQDDGCWSEPPDALEPISESW
jgi:hypothetical protein